MAGGSSVEADGVSCVAADGLVCPFESLSVSCSTSLECGTSLSPSWCGTLVKDADFKSSVPLLRRRLVAACLDITAVKYNGNTFQKNKINQNKKKENSFSKKKKKKRRKRKKTLTVCLFWKYVFNI
jgi:hypothetical protein